MINRLPRHRLADFNRFYAREVVNGKYPFVQFAEDERWHQRIYRDPRIDLWLISWLPTQGTELHDHGGSSGSFTVLSGQLTEAVAGPDGIREIVRPEGDSAVFGPRHIHDVRNLGEVPAVSLHAYSPPLSSMNFYEWDDGRLVRTTTLATDRPEPGADGRSVDAG